MYELNICFSGNKVLYVSSVDFLELALLSLLARVYFRKLIKCRTTTTCYDIGSLDNILMVFSSPEPKAKVSYCQSAPFVVVRRRKLSHFQLLLQNRLMDFDETWQGWSTDGLLQVLLFFGQIHPGRIQGGAKIGHGGPLLYETSSSDSKATAKNRMHSNYLEACGKKCCYF